MTHIQETLAKLRKTFAEQLPHRMDEILLQGRALSGTNCRPDSIELLHGLVHRLTGSAATFGIPLVSDRARVLESHLARHLEDREPLTQSALQEIDGALLTLQKAVGASLSAPQPGMQIDNPAPPAGAAPAPQQLLIYLVEDDAQQAESICKVLGDDGYQVQVFPDPSHFFSLCEHRKCNFQTDCEHCDWPAAVLIGAEFSEGSQTITKAISHFKCNCPFNPPVIVISAHNDIHARLAAYRAGACRYLTKPIDNERMLGLLARLSLRAPGKPYRVVLVDDDPLLLQLHGGMLHRAGMLVHTESQPLKVLDAVRDFDPDVVLLDVYMPECNGPELAAVLREHEAYGSLPILFLSSETDITKQMLALDLGGDDFLVKPVKAAHLTAAVAVRARRNRETREITARLQTALYEREREHFALNQHALVSITGPDGNIHYVNDRICRISGYGRSELLGQDHRLLKSRKHTPAFYADMWQTIVQGKIWQGEICNQTKDGVLFWIESTITPFLDANGNPYQYVSVSTEVTALKEKEKALQESERVLIEARHLAEHANKAKSEFLSTMSHEIRTPMNGVIGMTELLLDTPLSPQQLEFAQIIKDSAQALMGIINDILDFSKIEAGKLEIESIAFPLLPVIEGSLELLSQKASEKGITLMSYVDPAIPCNVIGDPGRLRQILINLVNNAVKFTSKGDIVVRAQLLAPDHRQQETPEQRTGRDPRNLIRFEISDSGIGMAQSVVEKLFQPFTQADGSYSRKYGGTGLGLSICKRLLDLMGGSIGASSQEGMGSTFWFELPMAADGQTESPLKPDWLTGVEVLVVDSNERQNQILCRYLGNWNMVCFSAPSGVEALRMVQDAHTLKIAIISTQLSDMQAGALAGAYKAMAPDVRLVLLANANTTDLSNGKTNQHFQGILRQPIKQSELIDVLASTLRIGGPVAIPGKQTVIDAPTNQNNLILLVEDNPVNQKFAVSILKKFGYASQVVGDGKQALEALARHSYALVLMDCQMPVMNGFDASRALRELERASGSRTPIIAMTANAMQGDRDACLSAGMDDYLSKPIESETLKTMLKRWMPSAETMAKPDLPVNGKINHNAIDISRLTDAFSDNPEGVQKLLEMFISNTNQLLPRLAVAIADKGFDTIAPISHDLAGSAANLGMNELHHLTQILEAAAARGNAALVAAAHAPILEAYRRVVEFIDGRKPGR